MCPPGLMTHLGSTNIEGLPQTHYEPCYVPHDGIDESQKLWQTLLEPSSGITLIEEMACSGHVGEDVIAISISIWTADPLFRRFCSVSNIVSSSSYGISVASVIWTGASR